MTADVLDRPRLETAKVAVGITFATNGLAFAGWFARAPAVRDDLGLSSAGLGLLLLCLSGAAIAAIPLAGPLVQRFGPARAVLLAACPWCWACSGWAAARCSARCRSPGSAWSLLGMGNSTWDVAMNVEGADVERRLGRTLMPRFHAGFSLGTVIGAGVSAAAAASGVSVSTQLFLTAALAAVVMVLTVRRFLPHTAVTAEQRSAGRSATPGASPARC